MKVICKITNIYENISRRGAKDAKLLSVIFSINKIYIYKTRFMKYNDNTANNNSASSAPLRDVLGNNS